MKSFTKITENHANYFVHGKDDIGQDVKYIIPKQYSFEDKIDKWVNKKLVTAATAQKIKATKPVSAMAAFGAMILDEKAKKAAS